MYILDSLGRKLDLNNVAAVENIVALKKKYGSNPWPVIEACFKVWADKKPSEYNSLLIRIKDIKETRKDSKFASTTDKVTGGILRYTLDIPQEVMYMIRCVYTPDELPMRREFFLEFSRRFPRFKIAEKL